MTVNGNKYRISSARLQTWDYSWNGSYFVTICAKNRFHYFGEIMEDRMQLSTIGQLAEKYILEIADHFSFVKLGDYIVMPNHVQVILILNNDGYDYNWTTTVSKSGKKYYEKYKDSGGFMAPYLK